MEFTLEFEKDIKENPCKHSRMSVCAGKRGDYDLFLLIQDFNDLKFIIQG
jgi:hypothetical protein